MRLDADMPRCPLNCHEPAPKPAVKELQPELTPRLPSIVVTRDVLRFEDGDDLMRSRIDDEDLVADQDVAVASPLGIDYEHFRRQRIETHALRHPGSHPHRHVEMRRLHLVLPYDGVDLGALLGRKICRTSRCALTCGGAILLGGGLARLCASSTLSGIVVGLRLHVTASIGVG